MMRAAKGPATCSTAAPAGFNTRSIQSLTGPDGSPVEDMTVLKDSRRISGMTGALVLATAGWSSAALADWSGKGEGGLVLSRGNSDSTSINAKIDAAEEQGDWKNVMFASALYGRNGEFATAQRLEARYEIDHKITQAFDGFVAAHGDKDAFEGFDYQATVSAGVGYQFVNTDATKFSGTLGVGYRRLRPQQLVTDADGRVIDRINGDATGGAVATAGLALDHQATKTTKLVDKLIVESGASNTSAGNDFAVHVAMSDRLALSVGYGVRYNTDPAPGTKKLDQLTTANIVYTIK